MPYNLLQIKICWCCPGCQLCDGKCNMQISFHFGRLLPANATKLQTTAQKYHAAGINGFKLLPGFFISVLHMLCQKREDAAKAFFLEDKTHINNPLTLLAVHTQVLLKMQADTSNLQVDTENTEGSNLEKEQWHHAHVHTDTHPHESTNILQPLLVL